MKNRIRKNEETGEYFNKSESIDRPKSKMMKKKYKSNNNLPRLGAGGLSLTTFAKAKSKDEHYNPAIIKKHREFYKNAKKVNKFKKLLKQQNGHNDVSLTQKMIQSENGGVEGDRDKNKKRMKKDASLKLEELYKKKHEEKEKERLERESAMRAKKEEIEKAESQRKAMREKMYKKTRKGQPVMKYRIEHILETLQGSAKD